MADIVPSPILDQRSHAEPVSPSVLQRPALSVSTPVLTDPSNPQATSPTSSTLFTSGDGHTLNNPDIRMANRDANTYYIYNFSLSTLYTASGYHTPSLAVTGQPPAAQSVATTHLPNMVEPTHSTRPPNPPRPPTQSLAADLSDLSGPASDAAHNLRASKTINEASSEDTCAEGIRVETGRFEMTYRNGHGLRGRHQALAGTTTSAEEIYTRNLFATTHGYPCANPCPMGPPIRIGDIGKLSPHGFGAIANLDKCPLPSLQSELPSLYLSDLWHDSECLREGESITGGVYGWETTFVPGSGTIQSIEYRCQASEGAIFAATSPAQLHTLQPQNLGHLRLWLCKHGMDLFHVLGLDRHDPLFIVTGLMTSSSWATAAYPQAREASQDHGSLVLSRVPEDLPQNYYWTRTARQATVRAKASPSGVDSEGKRIKDQCLFLRGFLITPKDASYQARHGLEPNTLEDFYPSHQINKRLLELTDADLAITHDDDWRFGSRHPSMPHVQQDATAAASGSAMPPAGDRESAKHLHRDDQPSWMGEQQESPSSLIRNFPDVKSTGSGDVASKDGTVHHRGETSGASKGPQRRPSLSARAKKDIRAGETTKPRRMQDRLTSLGHRRSSKSCQRASQETAFRYRSGSPTNTRSEALPPSKSLTQDLQTGREDPDAAWGDVHDHRCASPLEIDYTDILWVFESVPDYQNLQIEVLGKAASRTGQWLLKWEKYSLWLEPNGDLKVLWGFGNLGAGKTVLTSIVIQDLEDRPEAPEGPFCVCYIYFRNSVDPATEVCDLLEILVKQTVENHRSCLRLAYQLYTRHIYEQTRPTEVELLQLLQGFTERMAATFYVLEALNEAPVQLQFDLVTKLASLNVKLFITSRPLETPRVHLPDALRFSIAAQDQDLDLLIAHAIDQSPKLCSLVEQEGEKWREEIASSIKQKCEGMFLYASLQLEALRECSSADEVKNTLEQAPVQIGEVYLQTWKRVLDQKPSHISLAKAVLSWVLTASRLMTVEELQHAIAASPGAHELADGDTLIGLCQGLVTVDERAKLVRIVHHSARDTLERLILEDFPHPHAHLAEVCLIHLTSCGFKCTNVDSTEGLLSILQKDPLLAYAYDAWAFHSHKSMDDPSLFNRLAEFVAGCHGFPVIVGEQFDVLSPLHVAAFFDLPLGLAGSNPTRNADILTRNTGSTPLSLACRKGSTNAAEELLRLPLTHAGGLGNPVGRFALGVMALLRKRRREASIHSGTHVNLVNTAGQTPLMLASRNGRTDIVKLLLAHPHTAINLPDRCGHTALIWAASFGHEAIVKLLLAHPEIEVNLKAVNGRSALFFASLEGHDRIVKLLLAYPGTQVGSDMFFAASARGRLSTARLLQTVLSTRHIINKPRYKVE